jgi:hypothetical protein
MDEEDIQEFGAHVLGQQQDFSAIGSTESELKRKQMIKNMGEQSMLTSSHSINDLIVPIKMDFGSKLLTRMGVMPDGTIKGRRLGYGDDREGRHSDSQSLDPAELVQEILKLKISRDGYTYGRGFDPLADAPEFQKNKESHLEEKSKNHEKIDRGGFGIGVFEDNDEDESFLMGGPIGYSAVLLDEEEEEQFRIKQIKEKEKQEVKKSVKTKAGVISGFVSVPRSVAPPARL